MVIEGPGYEKAGVDQKYPRGIEESVSKRATRKKGARRSVVTRTLRVHGGGRKGGGSLERGGG